jgi:2-hydroxyacyl-CoA lyase 1
MRGGRASQVEMMEAFGGKGFFVEDPKHIRGALDEAMNHRGPALVNPVALAGLGQEAAAIPLAQLTC